MNRGTKLSLGLTGIAAVVIGGYFVLKSKGISYSPQLTATPASISKSSGTSLTVVATGFPPSASGSWSIIGSAGNNEGTNPMTTDVNGNWTFTLPSPALQVLPADTYKVVATIGSVSAQASFVLTP